MPRKFIVMSSLAVAGLSTLLFAQTPTTQPKEVTTPSGLKIITVTESDGGAKNGDTVWVHYTGKLADGKQFDSSVGKQPIEVVIGAGRVIKGWEEGLVGMKVGEKRQLVIPSDLGYGAAGYGPIPGGATLTFDMELMGIKRQ